MKYKKEIQEVASTQLGMPLISFLSFIFIFSVGTFGFELWFAHFVAKTKDPQRSFRSKKKVTEEKTNTIGMRLPPCAKRSRTITIGAVLRHPLQEDGNVHTIFTCNEPTHHWTNVVDALLQVWRTSGEKDPERASHVSHISYLESEGVEPLRVLPGKSWRRLRNRIIQIQKSFS